MKSRTSSGSIPRQTATKSSTTIPGGNRYRDPFSAITQINCPTFELETGFNLGGTPSQLSAVSAFNLLQALGGKSVVSGIQRFDTTTGRLETVVYFNGQPTGTEFPVAVGEGYILHMRQNKADFSP